MKNLLYILDGLLIVIWIVVFKPFGIEHLLLVLAGVVILVTIIFNKNLTER